MDSVPPDPVSQNTVKCSQGPSEAGGTDTVMHLDRHHIWSLSSVVTSSPSFTPSQSVTHFQVLTIRSSQPLHSIFAGFPPFGQSSTLPVGDSSLASLSRLLCLLLLPCGRKQKPQPGLSEPVSVLSHPFLLCDSRVLRSSSNSVHAGFCLCSTPSSQAFFHQVL